jgi:hypothetical protein
MELNLKEELIVMRRSGTIKGGKKSRKRHSMKGKPFSHNKPEWKVVQEQKAAQRKPTLPRHSISDRMFNQQYPRPGQFPSHKDEFDSLLYPRNY